MQVIFLVLVLAIPSMSLIIYSGMAERDGAIDDAKMVCLKFVNNIASEQQAVVAGVQQLVTALAVLPILQSRNLAATNALLADLLKKNPQYANIAVTDKSGFVWASAVPFNEKLLVADSKYFQDAVRTGNFSSGEFQIGRIVKKRVLSFGYPVNNSANKLIAVIMVALDLDYLQNNFEKFNLAPGSSFSLLDHKGLILYRNIKDDLSKILIGNHDIQEELFNKMRDGSDEGTFEAIGNDGKLRLLAYKKICLPQESKPYLYIRSSILQASATSNANAAIFKNLTLLMLLFVVGLFLAWLIGKRMIVNPIMTLKTASEKLAAGTSIVNVSDVVRGGELGELARTFDGMAEALVQRETARNFAEGALRAAVVKAEEGQRLLEALMEYVPEGITIADVNAKLQMVSRYGREILGGQHARQTTEEVIAQWSVYNKDGVTPMSMEDIPLIRAIQKGEVVKDVELVQINAQGDHLPLLCNAGPIRDASGAVVGGIVAWRDITERKKIEEILRKHLSELEASNKELESFSYSVSHDLRAPLRAIDGYARMILKKQGDKFDEDTVRKFNEIRSNTKMMGQLIDDLLAFSRLSRKNMSISELNMVDLIRDVWKELSNINLDRKMNLIVNSTPLGYGDAALVKQVYHNLLSNAVKFTKLRDDAHIEVGGYNDGNEDVFYVKDNGVGFDMKYYDKLFGVFQRLHNSPDFEGTGVGLATVQRIVHRQGGRVWAEGKVNDGATFYFTLPQNRDRLIS